MVYNPTLHVLDPTEAATNRQMFGIAHDLCRWPVYGEKLVSEHRFALRPEAGPVLPGSLTDGQDKAFQKIVTALNEARELVADAKDGQNKKALIDSGRRSRIFFVSGEPGSGKSSLYLTLSDILGGDKLSQIAREQYKEKYPSLGRLDTVIRWLEPIDLEVTGDDGENLLASVLVRISGALEKRTRGADSEACRDAIDKLDSLANDIGIAWDGNLSTRASSLDPASYSQEVMIAQRARLDINKRFRDALGTLCTEKCFGCTGETLFVLPIDDFYLKPAVSLELLRLLRMISIPRLFFLIMGELKAMEALFQEKALADWTAVAGPQIFGSLGKQRRQETLSRSREMSRRYFRKLLPVGQRAILDVMSVDEALKYKPTGVDFFNQLSTLLSNIRIRWKDRPEDESNLYKFLEFPETSESRIQSQTCDKGSSHRHNYEYFARGIFEAPLREMMDLWICFDRLVKQQLKDSEKKGPPEDTPQYMVEIFDIVLQSIEEQDFLTEDRQELLRSAFPTSYRAHPVRTDMFSMKANVSRRLRRTCKSLFLRKHFGWRTHVVDKNTGGSGVKAFSHLPPRPTAWIILLHDLSVNQDQEERSITNNLVHDIGGTLRTSLCGDPGFDDLGWAWYRTSAGKKKKDSESGMVCESEWRHFPLPEELDTFRQLDRLLSVWNHELSNWNTESVTPNESADIWIHACWIATSEEKAESKKQKQCDFKAKFLKAHQLFDTVCYDRGERR